MSWCCCSVAKPCPIFFFFNFFSLELLWLKLLIIFVCVIIFSVWTAAHQAPLSFSISWSFLKFMSIESVMQSNHLILYHALQLLPSIFPSIGVFPRSQLFPSGGQSIGALASPSVLPMNIQGRFHLGLTGLILESTRISRGFSSTTIQKHWFFGTLLYSPSIDLQ